MTKSESVINSILFGAVTSAGLGAFLLKGIAAIILGILGALGGYIFAQFLKPKLDQLFKKKSK
jgi:hypothetical protein